MPTYVREAIPTEARRSTLDPELAAWLKDAPRLGAHVPVPVARAQHDALIPKKPPPIGSVELLGLAGPHGTIPVRVYHPSRQGEGAGGALIYLHGGGWTVGTLDQFEGAMRIFAQESAAQVYAVEYRLSPEYQYPVALEEAEAVLRWLVENGPSRGVDPKRIAVGGDSAGGNMTAVLALKMRDRQGPRMALQLLLYPETALPFETRAGSENTTGYYLETAGVLLFAWNYVPQGQDLAFPYITPLNADSHADLPPAYVVTNGFDPLRDVGHAYAQRLARAGNPVTYVNHEDLTHGFIQFTEHSKRALAATLEIAHALGAALKAH